MARINIEERIFREQGFQDLMIAVQSRLLAKGIVVELFQLAQEYWFPGRKLIPVSRFEAAGLPPALLAPGGLCELRDDGIYVRGSEDAFLWLFKKSAGGSARAASAKRNKDGSFKQKPKKISQQPTSSAGASTSIHQDHPGSLLSSPLSLLSSPNSSLSSQVTHGLVEPHAAPEDSLSPTTKVWRAYKAAYHARYGQDPTGNAKVMGQIRQFVSRVPKEEAPAIAEFFVKHPKAFYVQKLHEFGLCLADAEALRTQWQAGAPVTDSMLAEYRQKAIQPRSRGIAEIMAEKGEPIEPRLVSGGDHDPV